MIFVTIYFRRRGLIRPDRYYIPYTSGRSGRGVRTRFPVFRGFPISEIRSDRDARGFSIFDRDADRAYIRARAIGRAGNTAVRSYGSAGPRAGSRVVYDRFGFNGYARSDADAFARYAKPGPGGFPKFDDDDPGRIGGTFYVTEYVRGVPVDRAETRVARPGDLRDTPVRAPDPIVAPADPVERDRQAIVLFDPATVRAARARIARGVPRRFYRVRNKRRIGPTSAPPAGYPRVASNGAPSGFPSRVVNA